jgi:hypothetical protein
MNATTKDDDVVVRIAMDKTSVVIMLRREVVDGCILLNDVVRIAMDETDVIMLARSN